MRHGNGGGRQASAGGTQKKKKGRADGVRERTIERERDNGTLMIFFSFFLFTLIYRLCGEYGTRRAKERTRKSNDDNYDRNSFVLFVCFFLEEIAPTAEKRMNGEGGEVGGLLAKKIDFLLIYFFGGVCVCVCVDLIARIKVVVVFVDGHGRVVVEALGHQLQRQRVLLAVGLFDLGALVLEPDLDLVLVQAELARQILAALLVQVAVLLKISAETKENRSVNNVAQGFT